MRYSRNYKTALLCWEQSFKIKTESFSVLLSSWFKFLTRKLFYLNMLSIMILLILTVHMKLGNCNIFHHAMRGKLTFVFSCNEYFYHEIPLEMKIICSDLQLRIILEMKLHEKYRLKITTQSFIYSNAKLLLAKRSKT